MDTGCPSECGLRRIAREADARGRGAGVAVDVAEAFLHDSEQRQLTLAGRRSRR
jgi:uncharacterized protein (DUF952 family)